MDEHYVWELEDASGGLVSGGPYSDFKATKQEGMRYLTVYSTAYPQNESHKLTIRKYIVATVFEATINPGQGA